MWRDSFSALHWWVTVFRLHLRKAHKKPRGAAFGCSERRWNISGKCNQDLIWPSDQAEHKEAFVFLSVFLGPFKSDAAEAVMEACSIPGTLPGSILRSLKNRSLLEQPRPRIYQMHPLIQALAKKLVEAGYPHLKAAGGKLACAHFYVSPGWTCQQVLE